MSERDGVLHSTPREKFARLRTALHERREARADILLGEFEDCGRKWKGSYRCGSPGCPTCRHLISNAEKLRAERAFLGADNDDLGLLTSVYATTTDLADIKTLKRRTYDVKRKRLEKLRSLDARWNDFAEEGWWELDAVGADHLPHLFPQRRALLETLGVNHRPDVATWVLTSHSIVYCGGLTHREIERAFVHTWSLPNQVHIRPFDLHYPVDFNVREIAGYATKFASTVELEGKDIRGGKVYYPWPVSWNADLFTWMYHNHRSARELLRFRIGQAKLSVEYSSVTLLEPMPCTWLTSLDSTTI